MLHGGTLANPPSKATIEGFAKGLSQIASVANATARAALLSGLTVTAANPVWVYRQDTGNVEMYDGTTWRILPMGVASSTPLTYAAGWQTAETQGAVTIHRVGGWAWVEGTALRASGSSGTLATIPAGYRPSRKLRIPVTAIGAGSVAAPPMFMDVDPTGQLEIKPLSMSGVSWTTTTWIPMNPVPWLIGG